MTQAFNLSQFANKVNTSGQADLTTAVTGTLPVANGGTGITSAGSNGNVLTSNGSTWTSAAPPSSAPTTAQVLTATAGASVGAVGTYSYLIQTTGGINSNPGTNYAGSGLAYTGGMSSGVTVNASFATGGNNGTPSGTWKCMAGSSQISGYHTSTLFLRVS
jgi:hypothetical protein